MSMFDIKRSVWPRIGVKKRKLLLSGHLHSAATILTAAGAIFILSACQDDKSASDSHVRPVKAIVVHKVTGAITRTFSGAVRARVESKLGFRVPGKILERKVDIGDSVKAGQVIARLDDKDMMLNLNSAKANVAAAKSRFTVAATALNRAQFLFARGHTPKAVIDQRQLEFDAADSSLKAAQAQAQQAENTTKYATLTAPDSGIVSAVHAEAGQVVAAGTPVISLAETGAIEVALAVPEQDVTQLTIGAAVDLSLWADSSLKAKGRIREIAGQADPASRTYAVRVAIIDPPATIRLGMTASATLRLGKRPPRIIVPISAITQIDDDNVVYVADRKSFKVEPRKVTLAGLTDNGVKIASGLRPGDIVVTAGVQFLKPGKKVKLSEAVIKTASVQ
ncbi:MAG: efflux RND transporter periplasmic adaptor subunit [Alphaproteobacteria bacterium]